MARDAGGAVPVRIQINIYGEDGISTVLSSTASTANCVRGLPLHIDPIKKWERTLCWSVGARATFAFGGKRGMSRMGRCWVGTMSFFQKVYRVLKRAAELDVQGAEAAKKRIKMSLNDIKENRY